ncbi:hypothetical protein ERJ75_001650500 [Trypanosoma vivax]|nr:hypothetical protein ERJ75_001650500 [Trypanosoma vivax]
MTSLFEQLQHVLEPWDHGEDCEKAALSPRTAERRLEDNTCIGKNRLAVFVDGIQDSSVAADGVRAFASQSNNNFPLWLAEMDQKPEPSASFIMPKTSMGTSEVTANFAPSTGEGRRRRQLNNLELARAALVLFTSNAGVYRPLLQQTLGFVFGFIDELLEESAPSRAAAVRLLQMQERRATVGQAENAEISSAHERMRRMEGQMAKLVEDATMQRDHMNSEIVASHERERKLEALLEHQMILSHGRTITWECGGGKGKRDAEYVSRLIARASTEKAVDELQQDIIILQQNEESLNRRIQDLLELNGRYAQQSLALSTRLSILCDYNISLAVEHQKYKNDLINEKQKVEKYRRNFATVRNVLMSSFVDRHQELQRCWAVCLDRQLDKNAEALLAFRRLKNITVSSVHSERSSVVCEVENSSEKGMPDAVLEPLDTKAPPSSGMRDFRITHPRVASEGDSPRTPFHLRSSFPVPLLHIPPVTAERLVHVLLQEWRQQDEVKSLDLFARSYWENMVRDEETDSKERRGDPYLPPEALEQRRLQLTYGINKLSISAQCGSLTYAYGLVSRKEVREDVFSMLEMDCAMLYAMCSFLDVELSAHSVPLGRLPVAYFASVLSAMYPSYPLSIIRELVNVAVKVAGNEKELSGTLCYTVLLPERIFADSESVTVANHGSLWENIFVHCFFNCIIDDVVDSWRVVEDSFNFSTPASGLANEQKLLYQSLSELPQRTIAIWLPALRLVLSRWDELKRGQNVADLNVVCVVALRAALDYLRSQILLRQATLPETTRHHEAFLEELRAEWEQSSQSSKNLSHDDIVRIVESLDRHRHAVWGPADLGGAEYLRHVDVTEVPTRDEFLDRIRRSSAKRLRMRQNHSGSADQCILGAMHRLKGRASSSYVDNSYKTGSRRTVSCALSVCTHVYTALLKSPLISRECTLLLSTFTLLDPFCHHRHCHALPSSSW